MKSVIVVTPTIGKPSLKKAIESVELQTYKNVQHLLVVDGPQYEYAVSSISYGMGPPRLVLHENVGGNGFYGHRIYAAIGHLVNQSYVFFLDEDNWYDSHHVETLVEMLETNKYDFVHSLRKIFDQRGNFVCYDDCESLGHHPTFLHDKSHLIDTSSYAFKREHLLSTGQLWHHGWGGDRRYLNLMMQINASFACSGYYTLCYQLEGNPNSVTADFFKTGNKIMQERYPNGFPWRKAN